MRKITLNDKVRFVLSNHMLYNTKESLRLIMDKMNIKTSEVDLAMETWFATNNWWENKAFVQALHDTNVVFPTKIRVMSVKGDEYDVEL